MYTMANILNILFIICFILALIVSFLLPLITVSKIAAWRVFVQLTPFAILNFIQKWKYLKFAFWSNIFMFCYLAGIFGTFNLKDLMLTQKHPDRLSATNIDFDSSQDNRFVSVESHINGGRHYSVLTYNEREREKIEKESGNKLNQKIDSAYYLAFPESELKALKERSENSPKPSFIVMTKEFSRAEDIPDSPRIEPKIAGFLQKKAKDLYSEKIFQSLQESVPDSDISDLPVIDKDWERPDIVSTVILLLVGFLFSVPHVYFVFRAIRTIQTMPDTAN
ncbi:hypothetical protein LEP1GSC061_3897 [Leptospira wolffii serovar Khorat str. Khorat-H2]|nr:hypothetical protein LEP1GSC061_3897 [Leptospira wolffii serovar Khorat str. Khorat-H2]